MTDISELVRMSQFSDVDEIVFGLHTTLVEERFRRPPVLSAALGNGTLQVVDDGGSLLAVGQVPSIILPTDWQLAQPNYARQIINSLTEGGWVGEHIAYLYPALVGNADGENAEDMARQFDIPSMMEYMWTDDAGELIQIVRTDSKAATRYTAHPNRIVVCTPPEGGMSVILPPVVARRLIQRFDQLVEMCGGVRGHIMHVGYGDLAGEEAAVNGINVFNADNLPPTTNIVLEQGVAPLSGVRDTRLTASFTDHMVMYNKRRGGAMYNGIAFRFYRAFLDMFGVDDGMNQYEMAAMYTMSQAAWSNGFKTAEDQAGGYETVEWNDGMLNQITSAFFRDAGSPDPRQMTPGSLLMFLTYAITAQVARAKAPPFLAEMQIRGPDVANASMRSTIRAGLMHSISPDETNVGSVSNVFLPPRRMSGAMPGSRTQRMYPTCIQQSRQYIPDQPATFCRWHPMRRPAPYPSDLGLMTVTNKMPTVPVPAQGMVLEQGEDTLPEPDGRVMRYRVAVDTRNVIQSQMAHGHQYFVLNFPTTRNGVIMSRRNLAMSPLAHRTSMHTGVMYVRADYLLPDPRYRTDEFEMPLIENSWLATLGNEDAQVGADYVRWTGRPYTQRSANPPAIATAAELANEDPVVRARALIQQQELDDGYLVAAGQEAGVFENNEQIQGALDEDEGQEGPEDVPAIDAAVVAAFEAAAAQEAEAVGEDGNDGPGE